MGAIHEETCMHGLHTSRTPNGHQSHRWEARGSPSAALDLYRWAVVKHIWLFYYSNKDIYAHDCLCFAGENAAMSDIFRVLHVDSSGGYLEQVSEMTSSHVKLNKPEFSLRGAMILKKLGLYLKVFADVLIYMQITSGLTLHVYLVPHDPLLQQVIQCHILEQQYKVEVRKNI